MRTIRGRLVATIVGLVVLTSLVLGVGSYAYVATSLRGQEVDQAIAQTNFNVAVLADELLPTPPTRDDVVASGLLEAFRLRGAGAVVDLGDGDPVASGLAVASAYATLPDALRAVVDAGRIGWARIELDGVPFLVTGARGGVGGGSGAVGAASGAPAFYFFFDASATEAAIIQLGQALLAGGLALAAIALVTAGAIARGILRPVREAGRAAERIAAGDLSARLEPVSRDEFGAWAASFNRMAASLDATVAELREAQARQRAFVADVSHELRTPMTALVQEAALVREHLDALPPDARRAAELLVGDVARLRALVDDLMELSRFDADAEVVQATEFDAAAFIRAVVAARAPGARVAADGPLPVMADRRRLERIVGNLLDNAREHAGAASVEVTLAVADDRLRVVVADRGPGVGPDELERLFERFHKADPSRSRGGSGLGLAIAREHAGLLGGGLTAELRPGGGMRFVLDVPVARPLPAGDEPVTAEGEAAEVGPSPEEFVR